MRRAKCIVAKGDRAVFRSGVYDGDFYSEHTHVDCADVAHAYAMQFDAWGEDTTRLHKLFETDELQWLIGEHSAVAERMRAEQRLSTREQFWRDFLCHARGDGSALETMMGTAK
jgi:hypothetical protein